jgi:hypothetical protein
MNDELTDTIDDIADAWPWGVAVLIVFILAAMAVFA